MSGIRPNQKGTPEEKWAYLENLPCAQLSSAKFLQKTETCLADKFHGNLHYMF